MLELAALICLWYLAGYGPSSLPVIPCSLPLRPLTMQIRAPGQPDIDVARDIVPKEKPGRTRNTVLQSTGKVCQCCFCFAILSGILGLVGRFFKTVACSNSIFSKSSIIGACHLHSATVHE